MARSRFTRGNSQRRLTQWAATAAETAWTALAAATAILDSTFTVGSDSPETIVRIRGSFDVQSDQLAAQEEPFGAIGIAIVSDQAVAIGVTAIPTPYTDAVSDLWMLHEFWSAPMTFGVDARGIAKIDQLLVLDSKAMRRISEDETLIVVVENGSAAAGAEYRLDLRILAKVS